MNLKNLPFRNYVVGSFIVSLTLIILILLLKNNYLPPEIPLFYGLAEGQEQLTPSSFLIIPLVASSLFLVFNIIIGALIKNEFLRRTLIASGISLVALSLISTLKIVFLVGTF